MNTSAPSSAAPAPDRDRPADGPLFRRYLRWAEPRYARMPPEMAAWSRHVDRWLYTTPGGRLFCLAMLGVLAAMCWGLARLGLPPVAATLAGVALWFTLLTTAIAPWFKPEQFTGRRLLRTSAVSLLLGLAGAAVGVALALLTRRDAPHLDRIGLVLLQAMPLIAGMVALMLGAQWGVASWRRHLLAMEVDRLQLVHERDQAALRSQQAEMRVLQAQIQPHFIFNTLAALQHWVDNGDPRAGPMLRALTGFLRAGTELIGRERAPIVEEAAMARQYLTIMQQRLGARMTWRDEIPADLGTSSLPAGLLMTLVENAVEHGVEASVHPVLVVMGGDLDGDRRRLWVEDDGPGLADGAPPAEGVGLANVRSRLHHAFGPDARLQLQARDGGGCRAELSWRQTARIDTTPGNDTDGSPQA